MLDTREYGELVDWHRPPKQDTGRLTGDCLIGPVTNKFRPERGGASTFPKQMHTGLLPAAAARCLSVTIALCVIDISKSCRHSVSCPDLIRCETIYDDPTLASAFAGALRLVIHS